VNSAKTKKLFNLFSISPLLLIKVNQT